jgi:UDP-N-acetylglucosamine--N-acetylmuramyl-(pentapeptide) pyrophosphoryl-undecaprenol N-acetylglucosamine transferase
MARIAVSCGGTGGHVFPGVATAQTLRRRGHEVSLLMAGRSIESATRFAWDGRVVNTGASKLSMKPLRLLPSLINLYCVYRRCRREFIRHRPAALLSMGSYSSAGPILASYRLKIPIILHEANVVPGKATETFGRFATAIAITFPETSAYLKSTKTVLTGLPLRKDLEHSSTLPHKSRERQTLLVMGGSQGAQRINQLMPDVIALIQASGLPLDVIHLAGSSDRDTVAKAYANARVTAEVHGFQQDMAAVYKRTDFAISRAGANSCLELAMFGIPSLLIPYPFSARDHQVANARAMAAVQAADMIEQKDITVDGLTNHLRKRLTDSIALSAMRQAAHQRAILGADEKLADLVEEVTRPR